MKIVEQIFSDIIDTGNTLGGEFRFILPIAGRAKIFQLLVSQKAGNLDGFSFELYSKYAACPSNYPTLDAAPPAAEPVPGLYLVTPAIVAASTVNVAAVRDSNGIAYVNNGSSSANGRIEESYGRLLVTNPGNTKKFDVRVVYAEHDS